MRLKQRAFREAAIGDWVARARASLAFKRRVAMDQARALVDQSFRATETRQVGWASIASSALSSGSSQHVGCVLLGGIPVRQLC